MRKESFTSKLIHSDRELTTAVQAAFPLPILFLGILQWVQFGS